MKKISNAVFRIIRFIVWVVYPKTEFHGMENLPDEAFIAVGNHAQMNSPIVCELYFPRPNLIWTAGEMMHIKEVPEYSYRDFWSYKPKHIRWFYKLLSYIVAPISACIFNNAKCIGVYHDSRIIGTFRHTVSALSEGKSIVILPENYTPYNNLVWDFTDRFVDVGSMYYRKTGRDVSFVPMYIAPALKSAYFGKPVKYNHNEKKESERERICRALQEGITEVAVNLPEHKVVPYPNMSKKDYPTNRDVKEVSNEKD